MTNEPQLFFLQIWSIAVNRTEEFLVSGGADSVINIWKVRITSKQSPMSGYSRVTLKKYFLWVEVIGRVNCQIKFYIYGRQCNGENYCESSNIYL